MYYKEKFMAYMQQITQPIGDMVKIKHLFKIWATISGASYVKAVKFADEIVNDSVTSEWKSGSTTASCVVDMQKEYEVRAVGHYPVFLPVTKAHDVKEKMGGFAAEYEISVSCDGKNYEKCADGLVRIYGAEVIASFKCENKQSKNRRIFPFTLALFVVIRAWA